MNKQAVIWGVLYFYFVAGCFSKSVSSRNHSNFLIDYIWHEMWSIDLRTMEWENRPPMSMSRFKHACGVIRLGIETEAVVVAGGVDDRTNLVSRVETILVKETSGGNYNFASDWELAPNLPMALNDAVSSTSSDQKVMYIIGGKAIDEISRFLFKLTCSWAIPLGVDQLQCSWAIVEYELPRPSAMAVALALPQPTMANREYLDGSDCTKSRVISCSVQFLLDTIRASIYFPTMDVFRFFG